MSRPLYLAAGVGGVLGVSIVWLLSIEIKKGEVDIYIEITVQH